MEKVAYYNIMYHKNHFRQKYIFCDLCIIMKWWKYIQFS
jgi:hypothetical protein